MAEEKVRADCSWLPPYFIRRSARAKYIRLVVSPSKGLELVLPKQFTEEEGLNFLIKKRNWIEKHYFRIADHIDNKITFQREIVLPAIHRSWEIKYEPLKVTLKMISTPSQLCFIGKVDKFSQCVPLLRDWLKQVASETMEPRLEQMSQITGLKYHQVSWRFQRSRWGSCSSAGNISLNGLLLFLSPQLANYVMLHELCHTRYMSHGKRFWQLMARHQQNYLALERRLKQIEEIIPNWCKLL